MSIDVQAFLRSLTPEQLAECVEIETRDWPEEEARGLWLNLGSDQTALLRCLGACGLTEQELQDELGLNSSKELEQVLNRLRTQLSGMGINPQEVYHVAFVANSEAGGVERYFFANDEFFSGWNQGHRNPAT